MEHAKTWFAYFLATIYTKWKDMQSKRNCQLAETIPIWFQIFAYQFETPPDMLKADASLPLHHDQSEDIYKLELKSLVS